MFARTLHETLDEAATRRPDIPIDFPSEKRSMTLQELAARSRTTAASLAAGGARTGDRIGLLCPNEPEFLVALFAASRLGCATCPLPVPTSPKDVDSYLARLSRIAEAAGMRQLALSPRYDAFGEILAQTLPGVTLVNPAVEPGDVEPPAETTLPDVSPDTSVIVQFTSGSTAAPKGVVLSHQNVLTCLEAISHGIELTERDGLGLWLPLFHDMGLFATLSALFVPVPATVWSPTSFIKRPERWLREFADSGASISAGPDFGYNYLTAAVDPEEAPTYDLSNWRVAFNGAEVIRHATTTAFLERFAPAGFRPSTMFSVYGLAEATLAVTFPPLGRSPQWEWVDRERLASEGLAVPVAEDDPGARAVASVGRPVRGMELLLAEPGHERGLPDGRVGEILIRGGSVAARYLSVDASANDAFTPGGWLRTGDLGYLRNGELFVTGRLKEMIVVRGHNFYPHDVEELARGTAGVYKERCVAYADESPEGTERIVLAVESTSTGEDRAELERQLRERVSSALGLESVVVRAVPVRTLPRTSSGKYQRLAARDVVAAVGV